jgi:hypothetical protein
MTRRLTPAWRSRATLAALVLPPLVHLVSLNRISRWVERSRTPPVPDGTVDDAALAEWVDRVLHRLPPPWKHTCLRRALVLHYLFHRVGRPAGLRIGVRRDPAGALKAHAWLVHDEKPYLEYSTEAVEGYQVLAAFPPELESR